MSFKHITSRDNPIYKQLKRLAESSRERRKLGQTLLDGAHLVNDYLQHFGEPKQIIIAEGKSTFEVTNLIQDLADVPTLMVTTLMFAELSPVASPTGILALVDTPVIAPPTALDFVLMLEGIQDPGNLGSMLRSAAAAGVDAVYLSEGCAEAWSPKALRGGQGAQFVMPIVEQVDLTEVIHPFDGAVLATTMDGEPIFDLDLTGKVAFIMGNEGAGVSDTLMQLANKRVSIPMSGKVESLNAAAATAVCLFERARQVR